MITLTPAAVARVKEMMTGQDPIPMGLRIGVSGGGCSGYQYTMQFENTQKALDCVYEYDGLKVFVDQMSLLYMDGCVVDFVRTVMSQGFQFTNPMAKRGCGCGSSFSV